MRASLALVEMQKGGGVAKDVLIEEFHVGVFVPRGLREEEEGAIRRRLDSRRFRSRLERTVRGFFRRYRSLHQVRLKLSR